MWWFWEWELSPVIARKVWYTNSIPASLEAHGFKCLKLVSLCNPNRFPNCTVQTLSILNIYTIPQKLINQKLINSNLTTIHYHSLICSEYLLCQLESDWLWMSFVENNFLSWQKSIHLAWLWTKDFHDSNLSLVLVNQTQFPNFQLLRLPPGMIGFNCWYFCMLLV